MKYVLIADESGNMVYSDHAGASRGVAPRRPLGRHAGRRLPQCRASQRFALHGVLIRFVAVCERRGQYGLSNLGHHTGKWRAALRLCLCVLVLSVRVFVCGECATDTPAQPPISRLYFRLESSRI